MPFLSKAQMRGAFSGKLGPEMKAHAQEWADATPNIKKLPEHITPTDLKKKIVKKLVKKQKGKGGLEVSPYKQADVPIDLLKMRGEPPTTKSIPRSIDNSLGKK